MSLSYYETGRTAIFASRRDKRFSWCAYTPSGYAPGKRLKLAVLIHGSLRDADIVRDAFIDFAEANDCVLLAPLFPAGIDAPGDLHNYKHILWAGTRYDELVLDMVEEVSELYGGLDAERFLLFGFSGGGQFVHRFFFLHPERLLGISIGAPGTVTLADESKEWWTGVRGMQARFGRPFNPAAMREVPCQLVVGSEDIETWDVEVGAQSTLWCDGINDSGVTRIERLQSLEASLNAQGIETRFDMVPGVEHVTLGVIEPVKAFFTAVLKQQDWRR